jgi:hypothetical protein
MRQIAAMVRKDLLRRICSPLGVLVMLAFPVFFALVIAVTFGGGGGTGLPTIRLLVEDRDENLLGMLLLGALSSEEAAEYFEVREVGFDDGLERLEQEEASALLRIPERATENLIEGFPVALELVRNPAQGILPEAAEQTALVMVELLDAGSRILRGPLDRIAPLLDTDEAPEDEMVATISVAVNRIMHRVGELLFPPAITLETGTYREPGAEADESEDEENEGLLGIIFLMMLPGVSVYALFLLGDLAMRDILTESAGGTLRRQLAGPLHARRVVAAKAVQTALLSAICLVLLAIVGWFALDEGVDPVAFVLLSACLVLAVTGAAALVYGLARTETQGGTAAGLIYLVFAFVGGVFFPLEQLPEIFSRIAPFSPLYWGSQGYRILIQDGVGVAGILPYAGVLAGLGLVLLLVGSWMLHRRVLRGVAG